MLGGCGSTSGNVYNRGNPLQFDLLARLLQDDSWSYGRVLKYFKKMENYAGRLINESERHGKHKNYSITPSIWLN